METITINDKTFELSLPYEKLQQRIKELAEQLNDSLANKNPLFIVVLNGAFMFAADLIKYVNISCEITFIKLASYKDLHSSGNVKTLIGFNEDIKGRNIVIVEDIVDTGNTLEYIFEALRHHEPATVKIVTLLFKREVFTKATAPDYIGIEVSNEFLVGYGLDYNGYGRNFKSIYKLKK